jgi:hypothetical protein
VLSGCVQEDKPVACTLDAKICPDGSAVGRVGPDCEFAPCPTTTTTLVCQDGDTRDATCPDGVTTYLNENCVDGEWHQVMYIRNPCEPIITTTSSTTQTTTTHQPIKSTTNTRKLKEINYSYPIREITYLRIPNTMLVVGLVEDREKPIYSLSDSKFNYFFIFSTSELFYYGLSSAPHEELSKELELKGIFLGKREIKNDNITVEDFIVALEKTGFNASETVMLTHILNNYASESIPFQEPIKITKEKKAYYYEIFNIVKDGVIIETVITRREDSEFDGWDMKLGFQQTVDENQINIIYKDPYETVEYIDLNLNPFYNKTLTNLELISIKEDPIAPGDAYHYKANLSLDYNVVSGNIISSYPPHFESKDLEQSFKVNNEKLKKEYLNILKTFNYSTGTFRSGIQSQLIIQQSLGLEDIVDEYANFTFDDSSTIKIATHSYSEILSGSVTINNITYRFAYDAYTYKDISSRFLYDVLTDEQFRLVNNQSTFAFS